MPGDNINVLDDPHIGTVAVATDEQTASDNSPIHVPIYEDLNLAIPQGKIPSMFSVNKFGEAADFDTADVQTTIWDGARS